MGACYETRADKTKFIIDEDYKIKRALVRAIQNYTIYKKAQQIQEINDQQLEKNIPKRGSVLPFTLTNSGGYEKIISKNKGVLEEEYQILRPLAEGGYGQVYLVKHIKIEKERAMKVIPIKSKNAEEKTDEEIELLKNLDHPNIVKLFEYFCDDEKYYLITEYCEGGDLFNLIRSK